MTIALYPGSFDPFHLGHVDTVEQATRAFDEVVVAVMGNPNKAGLIDSATRVRLVELATAHLATVRVVAHAGLTVEAARSVDADALVRSTLRDLTGELAMAAANEAAGGIETRLFAPHHDVAMMPSTLVRALLAAEKLDEVAALVPGTVFDGLVASPA